MADRSENLELLDQWCSRIESLTQETEIEPPQGNGAMEDLGDGGGGGGVVPLSKSALLELQEYFCQEKESIGTRESNALRELLWCRMAEKGISLGKVVSRVAATIEQGGSLGAKAGSLYLGMLLASQSPVYSLFSQLAFTSLLRCIRVSCQPKQDKGDAGEEDGRPPAGDAGKKGKGQSKGAKRGRQGKEKTRASVASDDLADFGEDPWAAPRDEDGAEADPTEEPSMNIIDVLTDLKLLLRCLSFKSQQESMKSLVALLVEVPRLVSEETLAKATTARSKGAGSSRGGRDSLDDLCYGMLLTLLETTHGPPLETGPMVLRLLAPNILGSYTEAGSPHSRHQVRERALRFVTEDMLKKAPREALPAVPALGHYLCLKAPERSEARALAVESVVTIVSALGPRQQKRFATFVLKLSRNAKVTARLVAVDVALTLLGKLPDPLGLDDDEEGHRGAAWDGDPETEDQPKSTGTPLPGSPHISGGEEPAGGDDALAGSKCDAAASGGEGGAQTSDEGQVKGAEVVWWGTACLEAILQRCSDKAPGIRARALGNLALAIDTLLGKDIRHRACLQRLLGMASLPGNNSGDSPEMRENNSERRGPTDVAGGSRENGSPFVTLGDPTPGSETGLQGPSATPLSPGAGYGDLMSLLRKRCGDDKPAVRKAALTTLEKVASLMGRAPGREDLAIVGVLCSDKMVSVRKAAMCALSEALRAFPGDTLVVKEWLQSALPLVMDPETTVQERCVELFEELVLDHVTLAKSLKLPLSAVNGREGTRKGKGKAQATDMGTSAPCEGAVPTLPKLLPPGVLAMLEGLSDGGATENNVKRVCKVLGMKKKLRVSLPVALQRIITMAEELALDANRAPSSHPQLSGQSAGPAAPRGAWFLLAEVSEHLPRGVEWEFLRTRWVQLEAEEIGSGPRNAAWADDRVYLLRTISNVASVFPSDAAAELGEELFTNLKSFRLLPPEVSAHVEALVMLCKQKAVEESKGSQLITNCAKELLDLAGTSLSAYIRGGSPSHELDGDSWQSFKGGKDAKGADEVSSDGSILPAKLIETVLFTIGQLALYCPGCTPAKVVTFTQALVSPELGAEVGAKGERKVPPQVRAHAWVALGKLCLMDDRLAKKCMPLFVQEMERSDSAAVRNNIMIVMTDLLVRYTALVDGYVGRLAMCLQDPEEIVRRQTFVLLTGLLQKDYVKWKGTLFQRFLIPLVDESPAIRELADYIFGEHLAVKAPNLAYNSFVETMFLLNDCLAHPAFDAGSVCSDRERQLFSLRGSSPEMSSKRLYIYSTLLRCMPPMQRLFTAAKISSEVLGPAVDGLLNLRDSTARNVLQDALKVLACKDAKFTTRGGAQSGADEVGLEDEAVQAAKAKADGKLVSSVQKKNLMENMIPILVELKKMLEERRSPLVQTVMECLRVLLKDYKNEIEDILVSDKQLAKELLYEMKKHEEMKARDKATGTPSHTTPNSGQTSFPPRATPSQRMGFPPHTPRSGAPSSRSRPSVPPKSTPRSQATGSAMANGSATPGATPPPDPAVRPQQPNAPQAPSEPVDMVISPAKTAEGKRDGVNGSSNAPEKADHGRGERRRKGKAPLEQLPRNITKGSNNVNNKEEGVRARPHPRPAEKPQTAQGEEDIPLSQMDCTQAVVSASQLDCTQAVVSASQLDFTQAVISASQQLDPTQPVVSASQVPPPAKGVRDIHPAPQSFGSPICSVVSLGATPGRPVSSTPLRSSSAPLPFDFVTPPLRPLSGHGSLGVAIGKSPLGMPLGATLRTPSFQGANEKGEPSHMNDAGIGASPMAGAGGAANRTPAIILGTPVHARGEALVRAIAEDRAERRVAAAMEGAGKAGRAVATTRLVGVGSLPTYKAGALVPAAEGLEANGAGSTNREGTGSEQNGGVVVREDRSGQGDVVGTDDGERTGRQRIRGGKGAKQKGGEAALSFFFSPDRPPPQVVVTSPVVKAALGRAVMSPQGKAALSKVVLTPKGKAEDPSRLPLRDLASPVQLNSPSNHGARSKKRRTAAQ